MITYNEFKSKSKYFAKDDSYRIEKVEKNKVLITHGKSKYVYFIKDLVEGVEKGELGITNPSKLSGWSGFGKYSNPIIRYNLFCRVASESYINEHKGTLLNVNLKKDTCVFKFKDNVTELTILQLVHDVYNDGRYGLTNPSKLNGWSGFRYVQTPE